MLRFTRPRLCCKSAATAAFRAVTIKRLFYYAAVAMIVNAGVAIGLHGSTSVAIAAALRPRGGLGHGLKELWRGSRTMATPRSSMHGSNHGLRITVLASDGRSIVERAAGRSCLWHGDNPLRRLGVCRSPVSRAISL
jgi:hypothetical protein